MYLRTNQYHVEQSYAGSGKFRQKTSLSMRLRWDQCAVHREKGLLRQACCDRRGQSLFRGGRRWPLRISLNGSPANQRTVPPQVRDRIHVGSLSPAEDSLGHIY